MPFDPSQPFEVVKSSKGAAPPFDPSKPFEPVEKKTDVIGEVKDVAGKAMSAYQRDVLKREPDIDYSASAPWMVRVAVAKADNPTEVKKTLGQYYGPGEFGQDKGGQWWVKEGGKKVAVEPSLSLSTIPGKIGVHLQASATPVAGAMLGGEIGAMGGPAAPFTVPLGAGLGAAVGYGIEEIMKYLGGRFAKTPTEEVSKLSNEAALNMALGGAPALLGKIGPALKTKEFGVTPESAATGQRLMEKGATPPIGSIAPEATGFIKKRALRNIVSGDPTRARNVAVVEKDMRETLRSAGMSADEVNSAMEEIKAGTSTISKTEAGESLVAAAKRHVDQTQASIDADLAQAKTILSGTERGLRDISEKPIGRIAKGVADSITGARRQFGQAMSEAYNKVHQLTGDRPVVDLSGAIDEARQIKEIMPQGAVPTIIDKLINRNSSMATVEEAHALRSTLRDAARMSNLPNMTPDQTYALYSRVEGQVDDAFTALANEPAGLPAEAANALKSVDRQYREGIAKFKDATLNKLVRDVKSGLVPDPEVVASTILREGNIERTRQVLSMVSPEIKEGIARADLRNTLAKASYVDETGQKVIDGKTLLDHLTEREPVMRELYGKQVLADMKRFASELAASDGKISAEALQNPSATRDMLRRAAFGQKVLDDFVKENPLAAFKSGDPKAVDAAINYVSRPGAEKVTTTIMPQLTAAERKAVQTYNLKQLFASAMEETPGKTRMVKGEEIERRLSKWTEKQQDLLLPYGMASDLRQLARDIRFLFPERQADMQANLAAGGVTSKSYLNPLGLHKRIHWFLSGWFTDRPQVLHWFATLDRQDPTMARQVMGVFGRWAANAAVTGPSSGPPKPEAP